MQTHSSRKETERAPETFRTDRVAVRAVGEERRSRGLHIEASGDDVGWTGCHAGTISARVTMSAFGQQRKKK